MNAEEPAAVVAAELPDTNTLLEARDGGNDQVLCPDCNTWLRVTHAGRLPRHPATPGSLARAPARGAAFIRPANLPASLPLRVGQAQ